MVSELLCFLCFWSFVSLTGSYTEDEPKQNAAFLMPRLLIRNFGGGGVIIIP